MNWEERIVADPKVMVGKPVIKGTRMTVEFITDLLANGWTEKQIMEHYPHVTHEDILACLAFANELVRVEKIYQVAG